nr:6,7-dimethyl-8-ribityllumazine synthase, chloroplastic-like [Tanacetum cinerariifolium]
MLWTHLINKANIDVIWVPGSFEISLVAEKLGKSRKYNGIMCIGAMVVQKCEDALAKSYAKENGKQLLEIVPRAHIESTNLLASVLQACKKETTYTSKAVDANSGLDHLTHQESDGKRPKDIKCYGKIDVS